MTNQLDNFLGVWFTVQQMLAKVRTATLVRVVSFTPGGGGLLAGTVAVQPLINQVSVAGDGVAHGIIYGLPYFRLQAGASAIVADPVAGDIGFAGIVDRDTSTVKASKTQANPGSSRRFDLADGVYFGGIGSLNGAPTEYVHLKNGAGVDVVTPGPATVTAGGAITITASTTITLSAGGKTWTFSAAGFGMSDGVYAETHVHSQANDSHGDTEPNTSGPIAP